MSTGNQDQWLDPQEWRELGDSTNACYEELAKIHGLDLDNRKHWPFLDIAYRQFIGEDCRFGDVLKGRVGRRDWIRETRPAAAANRDRGAVTRALVLRAYEELLEEKGPTPISSVQVARRAGRGRHRNISPRTVRRILASIPV
jgi:hypothetical protein